MLMIKEPSADNPALKPHPSRLFIETTTRCNLQCPMCMKQRRDEGFIEGDISMETFQALLPAMSTAEAVVLNGIGEPLLHPLLIDFIRMARKCIPGDAWVGFQSNGLLIDKETSLSLIDAGLDRICLSVDAISPETFLSVRGVADFSGVARALKSLADAKKKTNSRLEIGIEFVLRKDNLHELPDVIRWAASNGASFALVTQLFPYHRSLVAQAVYDANIDESVSILKEYAEKAGNEGLDIRTYFDIYMKYGKSDEDRKLIRLVDAMMEDALSRGVTLNLQKLFAMDSSWIEKTREVFRSAEAFASQAGMTLRLPELIPKSARRCEFVEDGSAFISWDGKVHPCYYLWHHYKCYINDMEKIVHPRVFGRLSERSIKEIWNDPEFIFFRKNVLRYDYPFCFNCSFALCDYVEGGEFEQDCYINTEPCGVCLWCMDVFQCMK